jgi:hypothetical protein
MFLEVKRWHCDRCYYWLPPVGAPTSLVRQWRADLKKAAELFKAGAMCPWVPALKREGLL